MKSMAEVEAWFDMIETKPLHEQVEALRMMLGSEYAGIIATSGRFKKWAQAHINDIVED